LLDYGCGDGTFLAIISDLFPGAVGTDISDRQVDECRQRFANLANLSFKSIEELSAPRYNKSFDVVTCTEVLEHCVEVETHKVLQNLERLCSETGVIIISVPVEIGPPLIVKQLIRKIANWRSLGDFRHEESYTVRDFARMVFAGAATNIPRPVYSYGTGGDFHGHQGFNWRALQVRIKKSLRIHKTRFSPLGWSRGFLSSQVWFVCFGTGRTRTPAIMDKHRGGSRSAGAAPDHPLW
jgi:SAM-dependent methyltransferase